MKKYSIDILLFLFGGLLCITYDYTKNLSPRGLLLVIQLLSCWFILRTVSFYFPKITKYIIVSSLVLWGFVEAIWGLGQLYGFFPSGHSVFKITGSFFNPGPYGGFIAVILPMVLYFWLFSQKQKKKIHHLLLVILIACILILPATLSRTAWVASLVGCGIVLLKQDKTILLRNTVQTKYKKYIFPSFIAISLLFISVGYVGYSFKKDSANGRLFMWKIGLIASEENFLIGEGLGSFSKKYAKAQMTYFMQGTATENEKQVAGSPEYAFNEYLRILVEQGFLGLLLFLTVSILVIRNGIKNKQWGAVGSFTALCVFAFASYPHYLWQFLLSWVLLGVLSLNDKNVKKNTPCISVTFFILLCISLGYASMLQNEYHKAEKIWKKKAFLYTSKMYTDLENDYQKLYDKMNANPVFIFEYASMANVTKQNEKANEIIKRGLQLSCDPMFYNIKGRNYHEMGNFDKAEEALINSTYLLPKRIYPYYLLTKLYADSANYQPEKMKLAAKYVLEETPKVHSQAIDEMRKEVRDILNKK